MHRLEVAFVALVAVGCRGRDESAPLAQVTAAAASTGAASTGAPPPPARSAEPPASTAPPYKVIGTFGPDAKLFDLVTGMIACERRCAPSDDLAEPWPKVSVVEATGSRE